MAVFHNPGWGNPNSRTWALVLAWLAAWSGAAGNLSFSGQWTLRASHDAYSSQSVLAPAIGESAFNRSMEFRLMPDYRIDRENQLSLHYEVVGSVNELNAVSLPGGLDTFVSGIPDDGRRVMDLTSRISSDEERIVYHRIDRLSWRHDAGWGSLTLGRAAITWGNGLVFNPMDLFNPFAPTDVERDYKLGDDLVLMNLYPAGWNGGLDWQVLLVPRRDPATGSLRADHSSLAIKAHFFTAGAEWDLLASIHYDEPVFGVGRVGTLGNAVWRADATVTFGESGQTYVSAVANIDRSWTIGGLNWYGSLEFHYNSVGTDNYRSLLSEDDLIERLQRGELYTVGRTYLAPSLQVEVHPLVNLYLAGIVNLDDPSGVALPRVVWSVRQNLELTLGGSFSIGPEGTEFGGLPVPFSSQVSESPDRAYVWVKGYF